MLTAVCFRAPFAAIVLLAGASLASCTRAVPGTSGHDELVYIGTNIADPQQNSIYLYHLSPATGELLPLGAMKGGASPTYLTMDAAHRHLYAVSETQTYMGAPGGGVSTLAIDPHNGTLAMLNQQPSTGASPCYISLDRTGKNALVANYVGGNVAMLPVRADGQLDPAGATDQHQPPTGPHKNQDKPHAHCFVTSPDNRYAFSVDLGTDKVYGYQLDAAQHQLRLLPTPAFVTKPGTGPRHLVFHPNGRWAYLENELNSTVSALTYNAAAGTFQEIETLTQLPAGFAGDNSGADVHVSPDGRFLYTSNRGDNSLAVFAIDGASGHLALVQHISTQGKTPRNFALDPSGQVLLVANQNSDNVFTYHVDKQSGKLTSTGKSVSLPSPMFVEVVSDFTR
ncbi:lactonase family protein [Hymenobacter ginkgonis]|nr:lactonase family protein [Hymenobacter ginkgonis]